MVSQEKLQKYAQLAVRIGVNVQKGQLLVLTASVDCAYFARLCMEEAYRAGAGEVQVSWTDEQADRLRYEYEKAETLATVAPWRVEQKKNCTERGCCFLYIESDTPALLSHIPVEKLQAADNARHAAFEPFQYYTMSNCGQWSIVAIPTAAWAAKVFPADTAERALEKLWDAVLMSVRIGAENDPVAEWAAHDARLQRRCDRLNALNLRSLHFTNRLGTDLTVALIQNHVWVGGGSTAKNGAFFNANMPTEEVFSMPKKYGVNGLVYATKPLSYQGNLVTDFWFRFQDGRVCDFGAKTGADALANLLAADGGSSFLGEVALIPHQSPISNCGVLFLNTLFDENASCHLALGASYPENLKGGEAMTREALEALGSNYSVEHCDFMFGSEEMHIEGETQSGASVVLFEQGNFTAAFQ